MSAGTVALVFVTIASLPTSTGTPTTYERHIIPAGASTEPVAEAPGVNSEVAWAFQKIVRSSNRSGYLTDNDLAKAPMKNTLASCNAYARQKIPLFEEAAEQQEGTTIADYRCLYIPAGYKLIDYSRPYDMSNIRHIVPLNPYKIEVIPKGYIITNDSIPDETLCTNKELEYPAQEKENNQEGMVIVKCKSLSKFGNNYQPRGCRIVKVAGGVAFATSVKHLWEAGGVCPSSPTERRADGSYLYKFDFYINGDPSEDNN